MISLFYRSQAAPAMLAMLLPAIGFAQEQSAPLVIANLQDGRPVIGTFTRTPGPELDFAVIDAQYGAFDISGIQKTIASIKQDDHSNPVAAIVRTPLAVRDMPQQVVYQLLGAGIDGLMFPDVETRAQAQAAVDSMRAGGNGLWPVDPDGTLIAMIQIESPTAIQNLEDILAVAGIGVLFLGPTDMATATGADGPNAESVEAMVQEVLQVCLARNIPCGYPIVASDQESAAQETARRLAEGFRVLAVMTSSR
jgi:4-hydroxy-2-oxoheptanedioate aldolase